MSIVQEQFRELVDKELAVTCVDGKSYRGRLERYDDEAIVLQEVLELSKEDYQWIDPTVSPRSDGGDISSHIDVYGAVDTRKLLVSLRHVIIRIDTISRIWPWQPKDAQANVTRFSI